MICTDIEYSGTSTITTSLFSYRLGRTVRNIMLAVALQQMLTNDTFNQARDYIITSPPNDPFEAVHYQVEDSEIDYGVKRPTLFNFSYSINAIDADRDLPTFWERISNH